ncbi:putative Phthioceranic/hydroxyphthioceranic acid synthase [Streptomyces afghaniensis 772]|uniref:Putative Phthioceranic/hydroxyphthioceranic acid synthase n=1 Tax=Streptomyces afghaniensis 772 TaxID=1283301 RepID=S4NL55_9ACTN|nr:polyketide synthase [Streptomyces afghaniensis]EPJ39129.1 putative Phthioceranic/hydroxyphthioceranic acid synthase [Streptomyces afghaniensis 772]
MARRETVREVPAERWEQAEPAGLPAQVAARQRYGCFPDDDVYAYEPAFFGINAQEAPWVDPEHRLPSEVVWEAIEHAGIPACVCSGLWKRSTPTRCTPVSTASGRAAWGSCSKASRPASRTSPWPGPPCCLGPEGVIAPALWGGFSPTGRCHTFDAAADGCVRGEGCGVVVLKRLSDAVRDGDRVLAVVRGTAVDQNGRGTRLSAPSEPAQIDLYRLALQRAGVEAGDVGMVEAHGPGT